MLKKSHYNIKKFKNIAKDIVVSSDKESDSSNEDSTSTSESEEDEAWNINSHHCYVKKESHAKHPRWK